MRPYQSKYAHYKLDKIKRKLNNEVIKPYDINLVLANTIYTEKSPLGFANIVVAIYIMDQHIMNVVCIKSCYVTWIKHQDPSWLKDH